MISEITEFSYGFALTNEIVGWRPVSAAPMFPSLIEEGRAGGGYDVRLSYPGVALYLQFKRSDCMMRANARQVSRYNLPLNLPYYRFKLAETGRSHQHRMLLSLDEGPDPVFYVAPRFHTLAEIDGKWSLGQVAAESIFVRPSDIGELDSNSHEVAYDNSQAWLCSEPERIEFLNAHEVIRQLERSLDREEMPLERRLPQMLEDIKAAEERVPVSMAPRERTPSLARELGRARELSDLIPSRRGRELSESEWILREIADRAMRVFNAQFVIIQERL